MTHKYKRHSIPRKWKPLNCRSHSLVVLLLRSLYLQSTQSKSMGWTGRIWGYIKEGRSMDKINELMNFVCQPKILLPACAHKSLFHGLAFTISISKHSFIAYLLVVEQREKLIKFNMISFLSLIMIYIFFVMDDRRRRKLLAKVMGRWFLLY